jgi:hypothetical protein
LFEDSGDAEEEESSNSSKKSKSINGLGELQKIENPEELRVEGLIQVVSQDFRVYKARWTRNSERYFVREFGQISNYIIESLLQETQRYALSCSAVVNPMKILEKPEVSTVLLIENFLPSSLETRMTEMAQNSEELMGRVSLALKIAKAIKEFHDCLKMGHGVLNPRNILLDQA